MRLRAATADRLEQENRTLRDELDDLRQQAKAPGSGLGTADSLRVSVLGSRLGALSPDVQSPARQPLSTISASILNQVNSKTGQNAVEAASEKASAEIADLRKKYAHLSAKHGALRETYKQAQDAVREFKNQRDSWVGYAQKLESKVQVLKTRLGRGSAAQGTSTASPQPPPGTRNHEVEISKADTTGADTTPYSTAQPTAHSSAPPPVAASRSFSGIDNALDTDPDRRRTASSPPESLAAVVEQPTESTDSTEGDDRDTDGSNHLPPLPPGSAAVPSRIAVKAEPLSDGLEVLHERSVAKRKRGQDNDHQSDGPTPRRVKIEDDSSDPLVTGETNHFSPHESLDLDIEDRIMQTPRRLRGRLFQLRNPDGEDDDEGGDSGQQDGTPSLQRASRSGSVDLVRPPPVPVQPFAASPSPIHRLGSKTPGAAETARRSGLRLDHAVASLAEDGLDPAPTDQEVPIDNGLVHNPGPRASRLDELLNGSNPVPQGEPALLRPNRQPREAAPLSPWLTEVPKRVLPFGNGDGRERPLTPLARSKESAVSSAKSTPGSRLGDLARLRPAGKAAAWQAKPKAKTQPLRQQPLANLQMDDFKINPKFNNGENFAFTEVVRGRAERADLPGCVDPDCCGKHFQGMAQAERQSAGPALIHRAADIKLLEDHLGDMAYKLGSMTRQEKEELWLEAKTRELANKHGKHRHRFSRRQSPPGFWNTDFPTTQENQNDKEEAEKREKRMIEERWRDALRGGGKWLFRDE